MKVIIRPSANRDVKKLPKNIKKDIENIVLKLIDIESLNDVPNLKKLKDNETAYRIRIKDYRLGFFLKNKNIISSK
jgi:mRNA-degrading endonuclease RelE of RelBE toxin-antitoxin system